MINNIWEFRTCKRPNGSFYGTAGQCRKGVEVSPEEKTSKGNKDDKKKLRRLAEKGPKKKAEKAKQESIPEPENLKEGEKWLMRSTKSEKAEKVVKNLMARGLSDMEARGVAIWLDVDYYKVINQSILEKDPDEKNPIGVAAAYHAQKGLRKLPSYDPKKEGMSADDLSKLQEEGKPLARGLNFRTQKEIDSFMSKFKASKDSGEDFVNETFMGTTDLDGYHQLVAMANVRMEIRANKRGQGQGKFLDIHRDGFVNEAEVIFPPGGRFKVVEVTSDGPSGNVIILEEMVE